MRHLLLVPLALTVACDPCAGWSGAAVEDPDGLVADVTVATIASDLEIMLGAFGEGRVCVDRVEFGQVGDDKSDLRGGGKVVRIDPDAENPRWELRVQLCLALDNQEHLSKDPIFPDRVTFLGECALGPFDGGWAPQIEAACGDPMLTDAQWFMAEEVYPAYAGLRAEGELVTTLGEPVSVPGVDADALRGLAPLGDAALALAYRDAGGDTPEDLELFAVDLATGDTTPLVAFTAAEIDAAVYGGPGAAVLHVEVDEVTELYVVEAETLAVTRVPTTARPISWADVGGAVSEGTLFLSQSYPGTEPLLTVDLATGMEGEISLPPPADPALTTEISHVVAAPGGIVATFFEETIEWDNDFVSIDVSAAFLARWDAEVGWTELRRWADYDGALFAEGATAGGMLVGASYSRPGSAFAAYDVEADALLVSSDLCLDDLEEPALVVGESLYDVRRGDPLVLQPIVVSE